MNETPETRLAQIRDTLASAPGGMDVLILTRDEARWLLAEVDSLRALYREELQRHVEAAGLRDVTVGP